MAEAKDVSTVQRTELKVIKKVFMNWHMSSHGAPKFSMEDNYLLTLYSILK